VLVLSFTGFDPKQQGNGDRLRQSLSELRFHSRFSLDLPSASRISIDA